MITVKNNQIKWSSFLAILFISTLILGLYFWKGIFVFVLFALALFIWALSYRLDIGWYILVFLAPMINWIFYLDRYWYLFQDYPQLLKIHAPMVDFWTVILFAAFIVARIRNWLLGQKKFIRLPGFFWFSLFILSALFSLYNVEQLHLFEAISYLFRFIFLWYFGFVVLGVNIIENKKILKNSLIILALGAVLAAIMGFVSFFLGTGLEVYGTMRSTPFAIGNWVPFGLQHIFLAEIITVALPIFFFFWYREKDPEGSRYMGYLTFFVLLIGLLTLSRAAWLSLLFGLFLYIFFVHSKVEVGKIIKKYSWFLLALAPIAAYLAFFLTTSGAAESSTSTRWYLTEISLHFFSNHAIFGNGVGSFLYLLPDVNFLWYEIGDVIDAHGIIQKLIAEQGLLGLTTFFLFIWSFLYPMIKRFYNKNYREEARQYALLGVFLIILAITFQLFSTQFYTSRMWIPITLAIAQHIIFRNSTYTGFTNYLRPHLPNKQHLNIDTKI